MKLRYRTAVRTHPGLVRQVNEDSVLARDDVALWIVADGMGGHANGQWASQTLVAQFAAISMTGSAEDKGAAMVGALQAGNAAIVEAAKAAGQSMGTTAVLIHLDGTNMMCLWVGDSRAYRFRRGGLTQLSRDHSVVQELVDRGSLAPEDAETHPMAHVLSRAVGAEAECRPEGITDTALPGDHYLLCSDGLTKVVAEEAIGRLLRLPSVNAAADRMIAETLDNGAPDNVTVVLISVEEATEVSIAL